MKDLKGRGHAPLAALLLAVFLALTCVLPMPSRAEEVPVSDGYDAAMPALLNTSQIRGTAAILMDGNSGEILFDKNANARAFPASTTKIMTLLLAVESGWDLDMTVTMPSEAADIPADSSLVPVYPGETMTFRDLLYGMMLHSGNDAANAVAVLVAGSTSGFVQRMNERAAALGCTGTHFVNAHGYHDEDHYTTAHDLALITAEALKHPEIHEIVSTFQTSIEISNRGEIRVVNTNSMLYTKSSYYYPYCIGVKTGTHSAAGHCYVGAAEKDGVTLIAVTLGCVEDGSKYVDARRLFEYGFTQYTEYSLERMFEMSYRDIVTVRVSNASEKDPRGGELELKLAQISDPDYVRLIRSEDEESVSAAAEDFKQRMRVSIADGLSAPVPEGKLVGTFYYEAQGGKPITASVIAGRAIEAQPKVTTIYDLFPALRAFSNPLVQILCVVLALLALVLILHAVAEKRRRERRRRELYEQRRREYARRRARAEKRRRARDDDLFGGF